MSVLDQILRDKRESVRYRKTSALISDLRARIQDMPPTRGFEKRLRADAKPVALIAETKKASPSKGVIATDYDAARMASQYASGGASCISVLTDEAFFQGSIDDLRAVKRAVDLPVLRKDFVVDELCVFESREIGSDCLLLIAAALSPLQLQDYVGICSEIGIDALVEVHSADEMGVALNSGATIVGVNNRDLATFREDLSGTEALAPLARDRFLVSESAINTRADVLRVSEAGAKAILVGESLMRNPDPTEGVRQLLGR